VGAARKLANPILSAATDLTRARSVAVFIGFFIIKMGRRAGTHKRLRIGVKTPSGPSLRSLALSRQRSPAVKFYAGSLRSALHRGNLGFPSMALEHFLKEIALAVTPSYNEINLQSAI